MKKLFISAILLIAILIVNVSPVIALTTEETFEIAFVTDLKSESNNSYEYQLQGYSNIKIDVYASEMTAFDSKSGISEFTHRFKYSAYTDKNGIVVFTRPSDNFLVLVDLSTLPPNMGIDKQTIFYHIETRNDKILLSQVADVVISQDNNAQDGLLVVILDKNGKEINADYSINKTVTNSSSKSLLEDEFLKQEGIISVGNIEKQYNFTSRIPISEKYRYIVEALEKSIITKSAALDYFIELYNNPSSEIDLVDVHNKLSYLYEDEEFVNQLSTVQKAQLISILAVPSYTDKRTYSDSYFNIYYEGNGLGLPVGTHPTFINETATAFNASRTSLVTNLSLTQPKSSTLSTKYDIYITSASSSYAGVTRSASDGTSYIEIPNITSSMLTGSLTYFQKGTVAHEYCHAIQNTYRYLGDSSLTSNSWLVEGFAEWASVRVFGSYALDSYWINNYLRTTYMSINDNTNSRQYGWVLLPFYIRNNHGGDATIANIIKNFSTSANPYVIINNGLTGVSVATLFPNYNRANYYTPTSYPTEWSPSWDTTAYISQNYGVNGYPNNQGAFSVNNMACHYMDFALGSGSFRYDVTINVSSGTASNLKCKLVMTGYSGATTNWDMSTSGTLITYSTNISNSTYSKGCVLLSSIDSSAQVSYRITIARS